MFDLTRHDIIVIEHFSLKIIDMYQKREFLLYFVSPENWENGIKMGKIFQSCV